MSEEFQRRYDGEEKRKRERSDFEKRFYDLHYRVERRHKARLDGHDVAIDRLDSALLEVARIRTEQHTASMQLLVRIYDWTVVHERRDYWTALVGFALFAIIVVLSIAELTHH